MIALASGLRIYLACGTTDMRKGMTGLAMLVQQGLAADPFDGAVFAFRGRRAGLIKLLWHDGIGLCMPPQAIGAGPVRLAVGHLHWSDRAIGAAVGGPARRLRVAGSGASAAA